METAGTPLPSDAPLAKRVPWIMLALGLVLVLALALRLQHLTTVHVWFDEALGWRMAQFSPTEIIARSQRNVHPPVHFLLLRGWAAVFGGSLTSLRWYAVVWGLGTVAGAYAVARAATQSAKLPNGSTLAGILAALAVAMSPLHVYWSQQIKMYTLGTCLAVWSAWLLLTWFQRGGRWRLALYVPTAGVLALLHHYGTFTVFAQLSFALLWCGWKWWSEQNAARLTPVCLTIWATFSIWSLWLPSFLDQRALVVERYWIRPFSWQLIADVWPQLLGPSEHVRPSAELSWIIAEVVLAGCVVLLVNRSQGLRFIGWTALVPYLLAVGWSAALHNVLVARFLIFSQMFVLIGGAVLISRVRWRAAQLALITAATCGLIWSAGERWERREAENGVPGMPAAIAAINDLRHGAEPVLVCNPMLYLCLCAHNDAHLPAIYAYDPGHGFPHFQGAPVMRDEEYLRPEQLAESQVDWVWTLDAERWLGGDWQVRLPAGWKLQSESRYPEFYATLVLRAYRHEAASSQDSRRVDSAGARR